MPLRTSSSLGLVAQGAVLCPGLGARLSEFPVAAITSSHKRRRICQLTVQEKEVPEFRFLQGSPCPQASPGGRLDVLAHGSSSVVIPFPHPSSLCLSRLHFILTSSGPSPPASLLGGRLRLPWAQPRSAGVICPLGQHPLLQHACYGLRT